MRCRSACLQGTNGFDEAAKGNPRIKCGGRFRARMGIVTLLEIDDIEPGRSDPSRAHRAPNASSREWNIGGAIGTGGPQLESASAFDDPYSQDDEPRQ